MASDATWGAPDAPPLPSPEVMRVIRFSAGLLAELQDMFVRQLHSEVTALIPGLAANGRIFCERMVRSLLWAATAGQPPHAAAGALRQVSAANRRDGFPEERYADVARALVLALRNVSGSSWDNSIGSAWISYFRWAEPHLRAGARQATAEQAVAQQAAAEHAAAEHAATRREAAKQAAAQAQAAVLDPRSEQEKAADVDLEAVTDVLDDEGEDAGYGQIMLSMTRNSRHRDSQHPAKGTHPGAGPPLAP